MRVVANAVIDYIRECALHDTGRAPTGRRPEMLRRRLGRMHHVLVVETAGVEAQLNIPKDLVQKLGHSEARQVMRRALYLLHQYRKRAERSDNTDHVPAAREMYTAIRGDQGNPKLREWKRRKGVFVDDLVLGSYVNDLKILSTAAHYVQQHVVELWTHNMDFTMFSDEIKKTFGLKVVDSYRLGG